MSSSEIGDAELECEVGPRRMRRDDWHQLHPAAGLLKNASGLVSTAPRQTSERGREHQPHVV